MATVLKVLGQASLGSAASPNQLLTAYASTSNLVPTGKAVLVKNIRLVNTSSSVTRNGTVNYIPSGGSARSISPVNFPLVPGGAVVLNDEFVMAAGDGLQLTFATGGTNIIDVVVAGIERDQA